MSKILNKLSKLMLNSDDKEILIKEYTKLKTRYNRLQEMLNKWDEGKLDFTPTCPREIYDRQLFCMRQYLSILEERANIENVKLSDYKDGSIGYELIDMTYKFHRNEN